MARQFIHCTTTVERSSSPDEFVDDSSRVTGHEPMPIDYGLGNRRGLRDHRAFRHNLATAIDYAHRGLVE